MDKGLLLGMWRYLVRAPRPIWQGEVERNAKATRAGLRFLSEEHQKVRDFVVCELPRSGAPITAEQIAERQGMPIAQVQAILEELERGMTFLFRDVEGAVAWAYPVTVQRTPHRVRFSSGEQVYAA